MKEQGPLSVFETPFFTAEYWDGHTTTDACLKQTRELVKLQSSVYRAARRFTKRTLERFFKLNGKDIDEERFPEESSFSAASYPPGTIIHFAQDLLYYHDYNLSRNSELYWGVVYETPGHDFIIISSFHKSGKRPSFGAYPRVGLINKGVEHFKDELIKTTSLKVLFTPSRE